MHLQGMTLHSPARARTEEGAAARTVLPSTRFPLPLPKPDVRLFPIRLSDRFRRTRAERLYGRVLRKARKAAGPPDTIDELRLRRRAKPSPRRRDALWLSGASPIAGHGLVGKYPGNHGFSTGVTQFSGSNGPLRHLALDAAALTRLGWAVGSLDHSKRPSVTRLQPARSLGRVFKPGPAARFAGGSYLHRRIRAARRTAC